jgi:hypothetical protein
MEASMDTTTMTWLGDEVEGPFQWDEPEEDGDWPRALEVPAVLLTGHSEVAVRVPAKVVSIMMRLPSARGPLRRRMG